MINFQKIILLTFILVITFKFNVFSQENISEVKSSIKHLSDSLLILDLRTKSNLNKLNQLSKESKSDYSKNRNRLNKLSESVLKNIQDINLINEDISKNKREISDLRILIYDIEVDYSKLVKRLNEIEDFLKETKNEIEILKQNQTAIYEDIEIIHNKQRDMGVRLNQIPDLLFCRDCLPKFGVGLGGSFFPTNIIDIPNSYAWSIDARYLLNENISIIAEANFPKVIIRSIPPMNGTNFMVDKWDISIYSLGANFSMISFLKDKINISGGSSLFYALGSLDNFYNQTTHNTTTEINQNKVGLMLDLEIAYRDYLNKNPLEYYVSFNSYISSSNILLTNSVGQFTDIGLFLPSLKTGIRFNFY